jgi:hypothetical protein
MITSAKLSDLESTLVVAVEISKRTWLTAAHIRDHGRTALHRTE